MYIHPIIRQLILPTAGIMLYGCSSLPPMADVHLHYNWDHAELISAKQAVKRLKQNNVQLAVVFSVPSAQARQLTEAGKGWIIPFWSPYYDARNRMGWFFDPEVVSRARQALISGYYRGLGEVHLVSGMGPRRDNPVLQGLLKLAAEYNVPVNIHTDASSYRYLAQVCKQHAQVRFIWAHAGGVLGAKDSHNLLQACPNIWIEFSARDPWHYGNLVDPQGRLLNGWHEVIREYPDRFMLGTDPVWNAHQMYRWYEADEGWDHYQQLNHFHRAWIRQLPKPLQDRLLIKNARQFFKQ